MATLPADLNKLKLTELKDLCKARGLPQKGTKAELIQKLTAQGDQKTGVDAPTGEGAATTVSTGESKAPTAAPLASPAAEEKASSKQSSETAMEVTTPTPSAAPTPMQTEKSVQVTSEPVHKATNGKEAAKSSTEEHGAAGAANKPAEQVGEHDAAKTAVAAPAPRPAPRLVPASVNTTGAPAVEAAPVAPAAPAAVATTAATTATASAPPRQLTIVRKRKAAEPEAAEARVVREVPSTKPASPVIRITNLVRPFTVPSLRELLEKHGGPVARFWMDALKTTCVAEFASATEATAARNALHGLVWPPQFNTKKLSVDFATVPELEQLLGLRPAAAPAPATAPAAAPTQKAKEAKTAHVAPAPEEPKPKKPTLDELFRKTTTKPSIYWLPRSTPAAPAAPAPAKPSAQPATAAAPEVPTPTPTPVAPAAAAAATEPAPAVAAATK